MGQARISASTGPHGSYLPPPVIRPPSHPRPHLTPIILDSNPGSCNRRTEDLINQVCNDYHHHMSESCVTKTRKCVTHTFIVTNFVLLQVT